MDSRIRQEWQAREARDRVQAGRRWLAANVDAVTANAGIRPMSDVDVQEET